MEQEMSVYVSALQDSLKNKYEALQKILVVTQRQQQAVSGEELELDAFEEAVEEKEVLLQRIQELDDGFQSIYTKIGDALHQQKQQFKPQILEMQNMLRTMTDLGVKIQALEQKNKNRFDGLVAKKRQEIRNFQANNRTANTYNQHMANQHQQWQTYFMDKKQ
ncbi:MAG: hypothetical protein HFH62_02370 [Lachnospiraceae bacterium]|nr:hypothetical protein [Lachnospiraceae bacterium]